MNLTLLSIPPQILGSSGPHAVARRHTEMISEETSDHVVAADLHAVYVNIELSTNKATKVTVNYAYKVIIDQSI